LMKKLEMTSRTLGSRLGGLGRGGDVWLGRESSVTA
jgi:hypothetical protein